MIPYNDYKAQLNVEALKMLDLLQNEYAIPPLFSCIHLGGFYLANILAYYKHNDLEPPKELEALFNTIIPQMVKDHSNVIAEQYLRMNTEGTA